MLGRKFAAPRAADTEQWKKVQFLVEHGFLFQSVYEASEYGGKRNVSYPATLEEARAFVIAFKEQAVQSAA